MDKQGLFDVKEPLVAGDHPQAAARRLVVGTIGAMDLGGQLREAGFNASEPTTWLMEGLAPYLTVAIMHGLAEDIGELSAPGSALWLDGFSKTSVDQVVFLCCRRRGYGAMLTRGHGQGMSFHGVRFESGLDDYDDLWRRNGFDDAQQVDMSGVYIDGRTSKISIDRRYVMTEADTRGRQVCLMARAYKAGRCDN